MLRKILRQKKEQIIETNYTFQGAIKNVALNKVDTHAKNKSQISHTKLAL